LRINVTKSFLPPKAEYKAYIDKIWETKWLTNNGPLLVELEEKLKAYLKIPQFLFVGNGTIAIQLAIKALELSGEIITTPFSYCATTTSILWENLTPVFVDINKNDLNINADLIEAAITEKTSAILATHVYGRPCDVEKIEKIAKKHNLKVIYDAAHAFGVNYQGKSLLAYGDVATCSFHSTKVFHTIEGGSVTCNDIDLYEKIKLMRSFGHVLDEYHLAGINGKNSEFHAAMGLCNINHVAEIIEKRKAIFELYDKSLNWSKLVQPSTKLTDIDYNYAYYPVVFESETKMGEVIKELNNADIYPRRYFFPSLNMLKYIDKNNRQSCPVSEETSLKVLSLPLYDDLEHEVVAQIIEIINRTI
jgi:dTDP-4-amino-4,6-dideoxygalactose transaminase